MKGICDLTHCSESVLGIILPSMHQQANGVDFFPMYHSLTLENIIKPYGFLMFSGGRKKVHWEEMS